MEITEATRQRLNRPLSVTIVAVALFGVFVVARLATLGWDESRFVLAGEGLSDPDRVPAGLYVLRGSTGYDGQQFYRLALDPLTHKKVDRGIALDTPSYRQQRIAYPGLAWLASGGGRPANLSWALILINIIAIGVVGWVGGALAITLGRHAMWGSVFAFYPGFIVSVGRDLAEPLAAAFMLTGLLLVRRSRSTWAALALSAAILARETTAIVPLGLAMAWILTKFRSRSGARPAREFIVPLGVFASWQLFLYARWKSLPFLSNKNATDLPFAGLGNQMRRYVSDHAYLALIEVALIAILFAAVLIAFRSDRVRSHERWAFLAAAAGATLLSASVWFDHAHYLRALTEFYLVGSLILLAGMRANLMRLVLPVSLLWLTLFAYFARNL